MNENELNEKIHKNNTKIDNIENAINSINKVNKIFFKMLAIGAISCIISLLGYYALSADIFSKLVTISLIPTSLSCLALVPGLTAHEGLSRKRRKLLNENYHDKIKLQDIGSKQLTKLKQDKTQSIDYTMYLEPLNNIEPSKEKTMVYKRK